MLDARGVCHASRGRALVPDSVPPRSRGDGLRSVVSASAAGEAHCGPRQTCRVRGAAAAVHMRRCGAPATTRSADGRDTRAQRLRDSKGVDQDTRHAYAASCACAQARSAGIEGLRCGARNSELLVPSRGRKRRTGLRRPASRRAAAPPRCKGKEQARQRTRRERAGAVSTRQEPSTGTHLRRAVTTGARMVCIFAASAAQQPRSGRDKRAGPSAARWPAIWPAGRYRPACAL